MMGKVKAFWQEERDKKAELRVKQLVNDGYDVNEAYEMAWEEQDEEDAANDPFGMGA